MISLRIDPNYSKSIPSLSKEEYEALKDDISKRGLYYPIIVNKEGRILDGHHRYKICNELGIEPITSVREPNELSESEFVIKVNLCRRQLNDFQKAELAIKLEDIEATRARQRQLAGLKISSIETQDETPLASINAKVSREVVKGKTTFIVSKKAGISLATYERARTIIMSGNEKLKDKVRSGSISVYRGFKEVRSQQRKNDLIQAMKENSLSLSLNQSDDSSLYQILNNRIKLIHGDCIEKCKEIENSSVDLIFTDPPYDRESIYLYSELAKIASRVLKEGGSLVTFQGNYYLPQVLDQLKVQDLNYWWQICVKHNGGRSSVFERRVNVKWKSLLWFVKGDKPLPLFQSHNLYDFVESQDPDKTLHEWAQSTAEAEYIIKHLTQFEEQTVLDPFMGNGTTALAALKLKRKFIGIELDEIHYSNAVQRIKTTKDFNK